MKKAFPLIHLPGGIYSEATQLNIDRLKVETNGRENTGGITGHGIYAPDAVVELFDSTISENTRDGIIFKSGEWYGSTSITRNGGNGAALTGDLETETVTVSDNGGRGIYCIGKILSVNFEQSGQSEITNNKRGGIIGTMTSLLLGDTDIQNNGDPLSTQRVGHGIFAPNAITIFEGEVKVSGNSEDGITVTKLTVDGPRSYSRNNQGDGLTLMFQTPSIEQALSH